MKPLRARNGPGRGTRVSCQLSPSCPRRRRSCSTSAVTRGPGSSRLPAAWSISPRGAGFGSLPSRSSSPSSLGYSTREDRNDAIPVAHATNNYGSPQRGCAIRRKSYASQSTNTLSGGEMRTMKTRQIKWRLLMIVTALLAVVSSGEAAAITAEEAHAIGMEAYLYFYPLVTMDVTRKQMTNVEPGKQFGSGPMNMFVSAPQYPAADFK